MTSVFENLPGILGRSIVQIYSIQPTKCLPDQYLFPLPNVYFLNCCITGIFLAMYSQDIVLLYLINTHSLWLSIISNTLNHADSCLIVHIHYLINTYFSLLGIIYGDQFLISTKSLFAMMINLYSIFISDYWWLLLCTYILIRTYPFLLATGHF